MYRVVLAAIVFLVACGSETATTGGADTRGSSQPAQSTTTALPVTESAEERELDNATDSPQPEPEALDERPLIDLARACVANSASSDAGDQDFASVLACFEDIRAGLPTLDRQEADDLRYLCREGGGESCTDLLLRSDSIDDQLLGLACGGRDADLPCPEGPLEGLTDPEQEQEPEPEPEPVASAAQTVDAATRGNVVLYSVSEPNRPLYGWTDITTVAYCADGRFSLFSEGQRRTVLDNIDYRSTEGSGTWRVVDLPDGRAAIELYFENGSVGGFVIAVQPNGFLLHQEGLGVELQGPAGC